MLNVLLQKNDQGEEQPIDFTSKILRDVELKVCHYGETNLCSGQVIKAFHDICGIFKYSCLCSPLGGKICIGSARLLRS